MEVLRIVTLAYAAVLVGALAGSLVAIWLSLRGIGRELDGTREALSAAASETAEMEGHLERLRDLAGEAEREIWAAEDALKAAGGDATDARGEDGVKARSP
jgi:hypothetical protein